MSTATPRRTRDPVTPEDWQAAVNGAWALLLLDSARQYGLVTGGPHVNYDRARDLLEQGQKRGYRPQKDRALRILEAFA